MTRPSWQDYGTHDESAYPEYWDGVVGAWCPSLGPTGSRLFDHSRFANWGTLTNMDNATDWVVDGGQYALDVDGSNDSVKISAITFTGPFSISCWASKRTHGSKNEREIYGNSTNANVWIGFTQTALLYSPNSGSVATFTMSSGLGTWFHLVVTRDGTNNVRAYKNGVESSTGGIVRTQNITIDQFAQYYDNAGGNNGYNWDGQLDDLQFYNRALTANEVQDLYLLGRGGMYERRRRSRRRAIEQAAGFQAYWVRQQSRVIGGGV